MNDKNDVTIIELDRPRELRFGHKALKALLALTGKNIEDLMGEDNLDLENVEKIMYCGLLSDARANNEALNLNEMEDLLDQAPSYEHIVQKMMEAFNKSFGSLGAAQGAGAEAGNAPAQSKKQTRLTGSNR